MSFESYKRISLQKMLIRQSAVVELLYRTVMWMSTCDTPGADGTT